MADPQKYRSEAKRLRLEAETTSSDEIRVQMLDIAAQYERQSDAYYATARLWDDGLIDPAETRNVLGLALSVSLNAPEEETRFGVFRM